MQTTADGEYIPEKELDINFKIPRKLASDHDNTQEGQPIEQLPIPTQSHVMDNTYFNYAPVMDNSYYNFPVVQPGYFNLEAYTKYYQQQQQQQQSEKPLLKPGKLLRETIPDLEDETLPKDLTSMFQPLYCKLCTAQLSSNIVAKLHYKSKSHEKKVRKFLYEYSQKTGEPLHKRARMTIKEEDNNPLYYHCDVCDLPLTGKLHAESHYSGKNHRKAVLGQKAPAGKGFYTEDGKWVRQAPGKKTGGSSNSVSAGKDNIGVTFRNGETELIKKESAFKCDICNIKTTCREQLECHFNGQKHQKKLKQQQKYASKIMGTYNATAAAAAATFEGNFSSAFFSLACY